MSTTLSDVIYKTIESTNRQQYTMMPAYITDVSKLASDNVVTVQPAIDYVESTGESFPFPLLVDLPVQWPAGGGAVMSFPLAVGDDVLVFFSMFSVAEYQASSSGNVQPFDDRIHNLSDGYVVPSVFRNKNNPAPNSGDVEIKFGGGNLAIRPDGTVYGNTTSTFSMSNSSVELVDILSQTLVEISNSMTNTMIGPQPLINKAAITALIAQLDTLKE